MEHFHIFPTTKKKDEAFPYLENPQLPNSRFDVASRRRNHEELSGATDLSGTVGMPLRGDLRQYAGKSEPYIAPWMDMLIYRFINFEGISSIYIYI